MSKYSGTSIELTSGITPVTSRVALKALFSQFGEVDAAWLPPPEMRDTEQSYLRFENRQAAEKALKACQDGVLYIDGLCIRAQWRVNAKRTPDVRDFPASGSNLTSSRNVVKEMIRKGKFKIPENIEFTSKKKKKDKDKFDLSSNFSNVPPPQQGDVMAITGGEGVYMGDGSQGLVPMSNARTHLEDLSRQGTILPTVNMVPALSAMNQAPAPAPPGDVDMAGWGGDNAEPDMEGW
eukprot:gnl/MRDRNA2_/MRDRNA2_74690_c0_seq1.p1 gnl/MRDRNA2_/MRDRNA2_74690_c0~~gnl/MRDRNA2_/MRDRNA2_74690_c0_seq1.p1  ORF type:complete len:236 (+),score=60.20 gnl/MRDRNA2_/MRDRNA2_74690_c0_seq1:78-785(+)